MSRFQDLFSTARSTCEAMRAAAIVSDRIKHRERVTRLRGLVGSAQAALGELVLDRTGEAVVDAAKAGKVEAVLLEFNGHDTLGSLGLGAAPGDEALSEADVNAPSLLYLIRGPREKHSRSELRSAGLKPLLEQLRDAVHPFQMRLDWDEATNTNRVVMFGW